MLSIDPVSEADRIAIIGMAGRFPGAATVDEFWDMIVAGREGLSRFDENELIEQGVASELVSHPDYVPAKGVLAEADRFDAGFFGISPREADLLDPQQRVFLECAWEALESAGHDPRAFPGRIGVFGGASLDSYLLFNLWATPMWSTSSACSRRSWPTIKISSPPGSPTRWGFEDRPSPPRPRAQPPSSPFTSLARACCRASATWRSPVASRSTSR